MSSCAIDSPDFEHDCDYQVEEEAKSRKEYSHAIQLLSDSYDFIKPRPADLALLNVSKVQARDAAMSLWPRATFEMAVGGQSRVHGLLRLLHVHVRMGAPVLALGVDGGWGTGLAVVSPLRGLSQKIGSCNGHISAPVWRQKLILGVLEMS